MLKGINHLAFITPDLEGTIRFYRDLLGMELFAGIGHEGYRHYFFRLDDGATQVAFFSYDGASEMERKFPGERTDAPLGFDHVSFTVDSREDLFDLKDRLEAADIHVHGAVDHGLFWSIYFYDPNNIPLEATWEFMEVVEAPAVLDDEPLEITAEGPAPKPGLYPDVTKPTPTKDMVAKSGNARPLRQGLLSEGKIRFKSDLPPDFMEAMEKEAEGSEN